MLMLVMVVAAKVMMVVAVICGGQVAGDGAGAAADVVGCWSWW